MLYSAICDFIPRETFVCVFNGSFELSMARERNLRLIDHFAEDHCNPDKKKITIHFQINMVVADDLALIRH